MHLQPLQVHKVEPLKQWPNPSVRGWITLQPNTSYVQYYHPRVLVQEQCDDNAGLIMSAACDRNSIKHGGSCATLDLQRCIGCIGCISLAIADQKLVGSAGVLQQGNVGAGVDTSGLKKQVKILGKVS